MKCYCGQNMDLEYLSETCEIRWCPVCGRLATIHPQDHFHVLWTPLTLKLAEVIQKEMSDNKSLDDDA